MDSSSSSRKPNRLKLNGFGSKKSGYFVQDNGLVSLVEAPKPSCSPYLTSNLASRNASSSAGTKQPGYFTSLPPLAGNSTTNPSSYAGIYQQQLQLNNDFSCLTGKGWPSLPYQNASSSSSTSDYQPTYFNFWAGNGFASIAENPSASSQLHSYYNFFPCNGLASVADYASSSATGQMRQPNYYTFFPNCDNGLASLAGNASASAQYTNPFTFLNTSNMLASLSVADQASSSSSEKKQEKPASNSSFLTKPVPENFAFQSEKPPMFFVCSPEDPEPRLDLKKPILPKICVRCNSPFDFGEDGGIFMYKDKAYCSWDCRQVLIDIDHPATKENPYPLMKKPERYKRRKTTPAPRG